MEPTHLAATKDRPCVSVSLLIKPTACPSAVASLFIGLFLSYKFGSQFEISPGELLRSGPNN